MCVPGLRRDYHATRAISVGTRGPRVISDGGQAPDTQRHQYTKDTIKEDPLLGSLDRPSSGEKDKDPVGRHCPDVRPSGRGLGVGGRPVSLLRRRSRQESRVLSLVSKDETHLVGLILRIKDGQRVEEDLCHLTPTPPRTRDGWRVRRITPLLSTFQGGRGHGCVRSPPSPDGSGRRTVTNRTLVSVFTHGQPHRDTPGPHRPTPVSTHDPLVGQVIPSPVTDGVPRGSHFPTTLRPVRTRRRTKRTSTHFL